MASGLGILRSILLSYGITPLYLAKTTACSNQKF